MSLVNNKYVKKNRTESDKKVVSARIKTIVLSAFQNASDAAKDMGYEINLADAVEGGLMEAISEFKQISGVDYYDLEKIKRAKQLDDKLKKVRKQREVEFKKEAQRVNDYIEKQAQARVQRDSRALLTMSDVELKKYIEQRRKEVENKGCVTKKYNKY